MRITRWGDVLRLVEGGLQHGDRHRVLRDAPLEAFHNGLDRDLGWANGHGFLHGLSQVGRYSQGMSVAHRVIAGAAVLCAVAGAVAAGYSFGLRAERPREPLAVYALRSNYPDLMKPHPTATIGDLAADLCRRLEADEPATEMVAYVERTIGATEEEALNVVFDVWTQVCPDAPVPNRNGEVTPHWISPPQAL